MVVSEPVARNLQLHIGSVVLGPSKQDSYSPFDVKVVGIAKTDQWLMFNDITYQEQNHFPPIESVLVFAKDLQQQSLLDHWAEKAFKGQRTQIFPYHVLERQTTENFATLYSILDVVIGTLVLVITFMMGMLINIYQSQRLVEFGLLQAIGYTKKQLLKRVVRETATVLVMGWVLGVALAYGLLEAVKAIVMDPHAYPLSTLDWVAIRYTVPVPLSIMVVAGLTVYFRFRKFDPVGIVERRLV
jgi:ABC-type lipoprotein release transport system permease subunit